MKLITLIFQAFRESLLLRDLRDQREKENLWNRETNCSLGY